MSLNHRATLSGQLDKIEASGKLSTMNLISVKSYLYSKRLVREVNKRLRSLDTVFFASYPYNKRVKEIHTKSKEGFSRSPGTVTVRTIDDVWLDVDVESFYNSEGSICASRSA